MNSEAAKKTFWICNSPCYFVQAHKIAALGFFFPPFRLQKKMNPRVQIATINQIRKKERQRHLVYFTLLLPLFFTSPCCQKHFPRAEYLFLFSFLRVNFFLLLLSFFLIFLLYSLLSIDFLVYGWRGRIIDKIWQELWRICNEGGY